MYSGGSDVVLYSSSGDDAVQCYVYNITSGDDGVQYSSSGDDVVKSYV